MASDFCSSALASPRAPSSTGTSPAAAGVRCWISATLRNMVRRLAMVFSAMLLCGVALAQEAAKLAPYYPTPLIVVEKMLDLGGLKADEKMFDLGSGDGRIVIMAAQKYHADAVGVELHKDLCTQSMAKIQKLGLEKTAHVVNGDLLKQNYSTADLVNVYLLPNSVD